MNKIHRLFAIIATVALFAACSTEDEITSTTSEDTSSSSSSSSSSGSSTASTTGDLTTFAIAIDSTSLSETETIPSDDEDYIENNTFDSEVNIVYNGTSASYTGSVSGVTVSISGADVTVTSTTKGVKYILSGSTTDGSFKMATGDDDKKFALELNGVSIKNSDGPAINIQVGKRAYIDVADGTTNTLTDGTSYASSDEDQKGTIFSEGELLFSGEGNLRVYGNTKAGIASDDYILIRPNSNIYVKSTAGNGIKSNDGIFIRGGVINVETSATAAKALSSDGVVQIDGGRTIAITTGGGEWDSDDQDVSGSAGVKSDSTFTMNGGELYCKSTGKGGKGISSDQQILVNDGTIKIITTGTAYTYGSYDTSAKGMKSDGNMVISGGSIAVRATGGEGSEGIESKGTLYITGGTVEAYTYDDCINSAGDLHIQGGYVYAHATNNDGIDSNGNLYIEGGTTVAYGGTAPECGIDAAEGYNVYINGGTLVAVGGGTSYPSSSSKQPSIVYGGSVSNGSTIALNSSSSNILTFQMGRSYSGNATFLITSPNLKSGSSYSLYTGATATGTDWHGLITSATVSATGTLAATISSLASPYSSVGSSTGGMTGGRR